MIYTVKDWDTLFENNRTRAIKDLRWVPIPNRHDGDGYTELVDHENAPAHLGAWLAILQVASKCKTRGVLLRQSGEPHTPQSLARITRLPAAVFAEALPRLEEIGWIERKPLSELDMSHDCGHDAGGCGETAGDCRRGDALTERNGRESIERTERNGRAAAPTDQETKVSRSAPGPTADWAYINSAIPLMRIDPQCQRRLRATKAPPGRIAAIFKAAETGYDAKGSRIDNYSAYVMRALASVEAEEGVTL